MCGICGTISKKINESDLKNVRKMNDQLYHRGPDGEGYYSDNNVALAMRRLSIIDLKTGWQPIFNENHSIALIMNGEIYNYIELRSSLKNKGHEFSTNGDSESIIHLYEEYGLDFIHYLRGMFAFALWDTIQQQLILGRDRMGEKPLYLFENNHQLVFASELKALLKSATVPFDLDASAIDLYFHYSYIPEPLTPIKNVRKLDAGHMLVIKACPWVVKDITYWRLEDAAPIDGNPVERIREELDTISEIVIRSDVPVGVALSGGIDSSVIAVLAKRNYSGKMSAFSIGYPGRPPCDERDDAKVLADHLGMPFYDVELHKEEMANQFPRVVFLRDDPIADVSGYGYYAVSKLAHDHNVPVLFQGQGGDELFWGYPWVKDAAIKTEIKRITLEQNKLFALNFLKPDCLNPQGLIHWIYSSNGFSKKIRQMLNWKKMLQQYIFMDLTPDYIEAEKKEKSFYTKNFFSLLIDGAPGHIFSSPHPWPRIDIEMTRLICNTYLRENGIAQGDRLSMASSVELRLPLVDYRLVETVVGLRKSYPDLNLPAKTWLKKAMMDILPKDVMKRPKRGFSPPVHEWYDEIFKNHGSLLIDGFLVNEGIINPNTAEILSKGVPYSGVHPLSFKGLVLETWCRAMQ